MRSFTTLVLLLPCLLGLSAQSDQEREALEGALAEAGLLLDLETGCLAVPAEVLIRDELLEYVLVAPNGQTHESLFLTEVRPSLLHTGLLTLGVEPGQNARWLEPTEEGGRREVQPPQGDGFYLYAAWRSAGERYLYRVDDLISDLATGRSLRRHRWTFLGSRFVSPDGGGPEVFAADREGNLINVTFFFQGHTLVSAALPECIDQTSWLPNAWLLPERESPVLFVFSKQRLAVLPERWWSEVEDIAAPQAAEATGGR